MTAQDGDHEDLEALVQSLLAHAGPLDWRSLTAEAAAAAWTELDAWTRWLVHRYAVDPREIPPCWYRHGALVEELSALYEAHTAAYDSSGNRSGPAEWHHTFALVRGRIRELSARTGCRAGEHRHDPVPTWPDSEYRGALGAHIAADAAHRRGQELTTDPTDSTGSPS
jgi:hypothetical protein